eukprot:15259406-Alexandrium_andersonii.AAC.1
MSASLVGSEMCIRDRNMRNFLRRSKLELHGPRNDLGIGPRSSGRVHSVPFLQQVPNPPAKAGRRVRRRRFS